MNKLYNISCLILLSLIFCVLPSDNIFKPNTPRFNNILEACTWINKNISYKEEPGDNWKLPEETLKDSNGDCEDMAILLISIMRYQKGHSSKLILLQINREQGHAVVKHKNNYYDCTSGKVYNKPKYITLLELDYGSALFIARYIKND